MPSCEHFRTGASRPVTQAHLWVVVLSTRAIDALGSIFLCRFRARRRLLMSLVRFVHGGYVECNRTIGLGSSEIVENRVRAFGVGIT